jgi:hypothetical protein
MLIDRWDDRVARSLGNEELLRYRSNLLGADPRITNFGGGNTSAKIEARDPVTEEPITVLWVKGSGGDLGSIQREGFATLFQGKLLSLMSLQQLPRRIGLDFSDVFAKGFKFERIDSEARVDKGVMALKEFRMTGSAADVEMRGNVDLARETQDLRVRVIPGVGDTASTALVLVNPAVGAAALIAQRVLKNPLGQILAYQYSVTGSWSDPKVARIISKVPEGERVAP